MTTCREMLGRAAALSGLALIACGLARPASAQAPRRQREVVVNGRHVRTVDVHAHCHVPEANALIGRKVQPPSLVVSPERIGAMDEQGIDIEALSINPIFWYKAERELAGQVVKLQNEKLAEICATQPDRFVGLASVALQHPDLAAEQLEDAVKRLGLRGALIGGSVEGRSCPIRNSSLLGQVRAAGGADFYSSSGDRRAQRRGPAQRQRRTRQRDRQPAGDDDRIVAPDLRRHPRRLPRAEDLGGSRRRLPALLRRPVRQGLRDFSPALHHHAQKEAERVPAAALLRLVVFTPEGLRHLAAEVGASQIVMGTDYPFPWTRTAVDHILGTPDFSDAERVAMLGETAEKLLAIRRA
jgi:aminocarboxymuconate-semialdehyde decarboxylase